MTAVTSFDATPAAATGRPSAGLVWRLFAVLAVLAVGAAFHAPAWWVSLKAPNYPEHTFPDGIRIHFHVDGVRNGCELRVSKEVVEKEGLDCVHEMDTINHFVGMYPIASGGPVEKAFSPALFGFLGVLALGFALPGRKLRLAVMGGGFLVVGGWIAATMYTPGGLAWHSEGYVRAMVDSLGQAEENEDTSTLHPIVRQLRESLAKSGISDGAATPKPKAGAGKAELIDVLRVAYEKDMTGRPPEEKRAWTGSGLQVFAWHYDRSLNRWFNEPQKNAKLVAVMTTVAHALVAVLVLAMAAFLWIARDEGKPWFWLLALVPMLLPVGFLIEYAGWLWWYGHSLNAMGAFTLKPFMPTVLGQGKVAQFTTYSYPHLGFFLMLAAGGALAVASLLRLNALRKGA